MNATDGTYIQLEPYRRKPDVHMHEVRHDRRHPGSGRPVGSEERPDSRALGRLI